MQPNFSSKPTCFARGLTLVLDHMDWRARLTPKHPSVAFASGASASQIASCERSLGVSLPESLLELLSQSNGVEGEYGLGLVWPVERIESDNLHFRRDSDFAELYMSFSCLLFFGDAGNGDQFAFPIQAGEVRRPDVFVWSHEDDSRTWVASSLDGYLEGWLSGKLKV